MCVRRNKTASALQEYRWCTVWGPDAQHLLQKSHWLEQLFPHRTKDGGDEKLSCHQWLIFPSHLKQTYPGHLGLPVAQRAMNVCACFRIKSNLSLGRGSFRRMCSMKSCGVTAARFHFNFPSTTSSHSCKRLWGEEEKKSHKHVWRKHLFIWL